MSTVTSSSNFDPVIPKDISKLFNDCSGVKCSFCTWREQNPIKLGWEELLGMEAEYECDSNIVAGVELTSSQNADPSRELSTQQTSDYLAQFDDD